MITTKRMHDENRNDDDSPSGDMMMVSYYIARDLRKICDTYVQIVARGFSVYGRLSDDDGRLGDHFCICSDFRLPRRQNSMHTMFSGTTTDSTIDGDDRLVLV